MNSANLARLAIGIAALAPTPALAMLLGSTMGDQYYFNGAAWTSQTNYVVGAGVENTFVVGVPMYDIDIDNTSITFDYLANSFWNPSALSLAPTIHNGTAIRMVSDLIFTNVTIDPSTNMVGFDASRISWTAKEIQVDWQTLSFTSNTVVKLNVEAVPEPGTLSILAGAGLLAFLRRRKAA